MNKVILSIAIAAMSPLAFAQTSSSTTTTTTGGGTSVSKTTTTTSTGTLHEYAPGSTFIVKETSGPVKYRYGKKVTYVTKKGKTLSDNEVKTRIKVGAPVSVHYATEGTDRVVERVEIDD